MNDGLGVNLRIRNDVIEGINCQPILFHARPTAMESIEQYACILLPQAESAIRKMMWTFPALTEPEIRDVCSDAIFEAATGFDDNRVISRGLPTDPSVVYASTRDRLERFYHRVVKSRLLDLCRHLGLVRCRRCRGTGKVKGDTCHLCDRGWMSRREVVTVLDKIPSSDAEPMADPAHAFVWDNKWFVALPPWKQRVLRQLFVALTHRERVVWWRNIMDRQELISDEDLAKRFGVKVDTIRMYYHRAVAKIEKVLNEAQRQYAESGDKGM